MNVAGIEPTFYQIKSLVQYQILLHVRMVNVAGIEPTFRRIKSPLQDQILLHILGEPGGNRTHFYPD